MLPHKYFEVYLFTDLNEMPFFAELPYFLWGPIKYNSLGNSKIPKDKHWSVLDLESREDNRMLNIFLEKNDNKKVDAKYVIQLTSYSDSQKIKKQNIKIIESTIEDAVKAAILINKYSPVKKILFEGKEFSLEKLQKDFLPGFDLQKAEENLSLILNHFNSLDEKLNSVLHWSEWKYHRQL